VSDQVYAFATVHPAREPRFIGSPTAHVDGRKAFSGVFYIARI